MNNSDPMLFLSIAETFKLASTVETGQDTFEAVVESLFREEHAEHDGEYDVSVYNFSRYQNSQRKKSLLVDVSAVILDTENLSANEVIKIRQSLTAFKSICHTTSRHTKKTPKLRIIVPIRKPVGPMLYKDHVRRLARMLGVRPHAVSEDPNTLYPLPHRPSESDPEDHFIDRNIEAEFLDFDALPSTNPFIASKDSDKDKANSDERNYYDLAAQAQADMYGDGLVFVNNEFYAYSDGVWSTLPVLAMQKTFSRKDSPLHDVLTSPAAMRSLIDALKAHAHLDAFPDAAPMTVCVLNGVVDLNTGELRAHSPGDWHRNRLEIEYREDAICPRWVKVVEEVFEPDHDKKEKALFLQQYTGYLMTSSNKHQIMLWCTGEGANGKSVVIDVMQDLVGKGNYSTVPLHRLGELFRNAVLEGKLANFCGEISGTHRVNEGAIKEIVGGDDIYAEKKGQDGFSFKPTARLVATGNTLPEMKDTSNGLSRRLAILTFNRQFAEHERDHDLRDKLRDELPGIFVWALEGLRQLHSTGKFTSVPSSVQAVAAYKLNSNPVAQFMNTVAAKSSQPSRIKTTDLYKRYSEFCKDNGYTDVKTNSQFGNELGRMGIKVQKSGNNRYYHPVEWRSVTPTTLPTKKTSLADELDIEEEEAV